MWLLCAPHLFGSYLPICKMGLVRKILRSFPTAAVSSFMNPGEMARLQEKGHYHDYHMEILLQGCFYFCYLFYIYNLREEHVFSGICLCLGVLPCPFLMSSYGTVLPFPHCSSLSFMFPQQTQAIGDYLHCLSLTPCFSIYANMKVLCGSEDTLLRDLVPCSGSIPIILQSLCDLESTDATTFTPFLIPLIPFISAMFQLRF